jgi:hypothetical protein
MLPLDWYCLGFLVTLVSATVLEVGVHYILPPQAPREPDQEAVLGQARRPCFFCHSPSHTVQEHVRIPQAELARREGGPTWGDD